MPALERTPLRGGLTLSTLAAGAGALDAIPSFVAYWDRELRNRFANRAVQAWFGKTSAEMPGRPLRELVGTAMLELDRPLVEAVLAELRSASAAALAARDETPPTEALPLDPRALAALDLFRQLRPALVRRWDSERLQRLSDAMDGLQCRTALLLAEAGPIDSAQA